MRASTSYRLVLKRGLVVGVTLLAASACTNGTAPNVGAEFVTVSSQPVNVGDASIAAAAYHDSGAYDRDLALVAGQATEWLRTRAASAKRPALVLDVDETALSNWEVIKRDNFGRPIGGSCDLAIDAPCGWAAWDQVGRDPAIAPIYHLFQQARALDIPVFFITGRPENQREATERNLADVGYGGGYTKLYMVPNGSHFASAADYKAPIRAQIEQAGFTIIENVGDQPSDLLGGHAERKFQLPDPFYRVP
jgi:predicted secreted acid phosphatase